MDHLPASCVSKKMIRVLIVDDQPAVRQGLKMRLTLEPNVVIVNEADNGVDAIRLAQELRPDVVLMDVKLPGEDGISIAKTLRDTIPHSAVVILSLYDDLYTRRQAREAGAVAFVAKQRAEDVLMPTLLRVAHEMQRGDTS